MRKFQKYEIEIVSRLDNLFESVLLLSFHIRRRYFLIRTNLGRWLTAEGNLQISFFSNRCIFKSHSPTREFLHRFGLLSAFSALKRPENGTIKTFSASSEYFKSKTELLCNYAVINLDDAVALEIYCCEDPVMSTATCHWRCCKASYLTPERTHFPPGVGWALT